jgi:RNA polymerase sigma-70 factor, ECF subfamily
LKSTEYLESFSCPFSQLLVPQTVNGFVSFLEIEAPSLFVLNLLVKIRVGKSGALILWMSATPLQAKSNCWHDVRKAVPRGDMDAFSTQVLPYVSGLLRLAWRITRNAEDAEDVCQESLMKAFMKFDQFAGPPEETGGNGFRCWLMKITANSAIDFIRRKQACKLVPLDECEQIRGKSYEAGAGGWGENPEAGYLRREQMWVLAEAINKLPEELRKVCFLRNVNNVSTKDVAVRLRISSVAVRLRLFRAHSQLRKNLSLVCKNGGQGRGAAQARQGNRSALRRNEGRVV